MIIKSDTIPSCFMNKNMSGSSSNANVNVLFAGVFFGFLYLLRTNESQSAQDKLEEPKHMSYCKRRAENV